MRFLLAFSMGALASLPALAQDVQGRNLAAPCAICHGAPGVKPAPVMQAATKDR